MKKSDIEKEINQMKEQDASFYSGKYLFKYDEDKEKWIGEHFPTSRKEKIEDVELSDEELIDYLFEQEVDSHG